MTQDINIEDADYLSTYGKSIEQVKLTKKKTNKTTGSRSQRSQTLLLYKHLEESKQYEMLKKLKTNKGNVTSFYADVPLLQ